MSFFTVLFVAVALSMDSFAVSVSNGCVLQKIRIKTVVKIAFIYAVFQGGMSLIGWFSASFFKYAINSFDYWIAFVLLLIIGLKMIYESFDKSTKISGDPLKNRTLILMGFATSIDALAVGAGFAFLQVNIFTASLLIGLITFVFSYAGVLIGCKTSYYLKDKAELAGGIILIIIGFRILFETLLFS